VSSTTNPPAGGPAELEDVVERLIAENRRLRERLERCLYTITTEYPETGGLKLEGSIRALAEERRGLLVRIEAERQFEKSLLKLLIEGKLEEAKQVLNQHLFQRR
jgi:hypothetical protein